MGPQESVAMKGGGLKIQPTKGEPHRDSGCREQTPLESLGGAPHSSAVSNLRPDFGHGHASVSQGREHGEGWRVGPERHTEDIFKNTPFV